jgi:hypothetical protein
MGFDPEWLKMLVDQWGNAAHAAATAAPATGAAGTAGTDLAKMAAGTPIPAEGIDGLGKPDAAVTPDARDLMTRLGLSGGGFKDGQRVDVAALLRAAHGLVGAQARGRGQPAPIATGAAPPGHRPQAGALPMRQPIPGNPYLRTAVPGAAAIRRGRRGLLDEA